MHDVKKLSFEEQLLFKDHEVNSRKEPNLGGFVVVKDAETGKVLLAKKNLVVRQGRELTLRKIFNNGDTAGSNILTFGIGKGGAPDNSPFVPTLPTPGDADLTSRLPFRVTDAANPIPDAEQSAYTDSQTDPNNASGKVWYKKNFANGNGVVTVNASTDETFVKLELKITKDDARDLFVNELGLFFATFNAAGAVTTTDNAKYTNFKMFSRITFMTEPLPSNSNKALDIDYYVYL
jgi:hypothetical protein